MITPEPVEASRKLLGWRSQTLGTSRRIRDYERRSLVAPPVKACPRSAPPWKPRAFPIGATPAVLPVILSAGYLLAIAGPLSAKDAPHCMAHMIMDVAAEEAPEEIKSKNNASFGPVTKIKVDKKTGRMSYCSGSSYCYWANAFEIISACRIKRDNDVNDPKFFVYFTR